MPYLGAHMSIAGGVSRGLERAMELGCEAVQIFTKSNVQWKSPPLLTPEIARFREILENSPITIAFAHACYLINLAAPDQAIYLRSRECLLEEYTRCIKLGLPYIVVHPGSHKGAGLEYGIRRIAGALNWIFNCRRTADVKILLETTAGQGTSIGSDFQELADIMNLVHDTTRVGVCLDTCHIFTAGYDIRTIDRYRETMVTFSHILTFDKLFAVHLNDSKTPLGSRVDRHAHIGEGRIGIEGFRFLLNDTRFCNLPMVIETPKETGLIRDKENLTRLRSLIRKQERKEG